MTRRSAAAVAILAVFAAGAAISAIAGNALIVYVPYAAIGAILVIRRPGNSIGWLLTAIAWTFALGWLPVDATATELETLSAPPAALAAAWIHWWWGLPMTLTLVTTLAFVFPTGRLPIGRWRRPTVLLLAGMAAATVVAAVWPVSAQERSIAGGTVVVFMPNPLGLVPRDLIGPGAEWLARVSVPAMFGALVVSTVSLVVRYRRSVGPEHLQLRWLVAGLASVLVAIPLGFLLFAVFGSASSRFAWLPATVAFALPPVAIGVAVTRYHLYELDRLISRTLGWVALSALLLGVYAGGILVLQGLLGGVLQGDTFAVAASTLLAAALFQPLRRRIQRAMDHRFDRARYDGERTATAFADRLRNEVDLARVSSELVDAAGLTMRPRCAHVWLRGEPT